MTWINTKVNLYLANIREFIVLRCCCCFPKLGTVIEKIYVVAKNFLTVFVAILGFYTDFIKDMLIASHVTFLYTTFFDFKSQIVLVLWITIFLNQAITGFMIVLRGPLTIFSGRYKVENKWKKILIRIAFAIFAPISPVLIIYMDAKLGIEIEKLKKKLNKDLVVLEPIENNNIRNKLEEFQDHENLVKAKRELEKVINKASKIGIIFENTPQVVKSF